MTEPIVRYGIAGTCGDGQGMLIEQHERIVGQQWSALVAEIAERNGQLADKQAEVQRLRAEIVHQQSILTGRDHPLIQQLETEGSQLREQVRVLREAMDKLARLGNEPMLGNSRGNVIAQEALAQTAPGEQR